MRPTPEVVEFLANTMRELMLEPQIEPWENTAYMELALGLAEATGELYDSSLFQPIEHYKEITSALEIAINNDKVPTELERAMVGILYDEFAQNHELITRGVVAIDSEGNEYYSYMDIYASFFSLQWEGYDQLRDTDIVYTEAEEPSIPIWQQPWKWPEDIKKDWRTMPLAEFREKHPDYVSPDPNWTPMFPKRRN